MSQETKEENEILDFDELNFVEGDYGPGKHMRM